VSKKQRFVCGLDVGTEKICCLVARVRPDGRPEVLGSGYYPSAGMKKGAVVELEQAAAAIRKAAQEAELKSMASIDWVTVGISGDHIQGVNCRGAIPIQGKHREITGDHIAQVIRASQTVDVPADREVVHVLPQEFFLDGRGGIQNPAGLTGTRLDVDVHLVTCSSYAVQNLINAVNKAQLRVRKVVLPQLASAEAVLTRDEKDLGTALIDIGGGTTDLALVSRNALRGTSVLPVGGGNFTRDLAIALRTTLDEAERVKKAQGSVLVDRIAEDEMVEVAGVATRGPREIPRRIIAQVLRDRAVEVLELARNEIMRSGGRNHSLSGVVVTGGGSLLHGLLPLAEQILELPVRQGLPLGLPGLTEELVHPVYATAVGLTLFAVEGRGERGTQPSNAGTTPWFVHRLLSWVGS